jgi:cell division transport system permease protein
MIRYLKKALQDIASNRFLNIVTMMTIALSILIISAFILFSVNAGRILSLWQEGIKMMVYLSETVTDRQLPEIKNKIKSTRGVQHIRFISKHDALAKLKIQMQRQASLFSDLKENPLPDAFEITIDPSWRNSRKLEHVAKGIDSIQGVDDVEYGRAWLNRFANIFNLFRLTTGAMGGLFFIAIIFIVANTIRLVLYSRRDEIEIMRLVGATNRFIKTPFYLQGILQGALGGIIGLIILFFAYQFISANFVQNLLPGEFQVQFLSPVYCLSIVLGSVFVGWAGCYLSLKQFVID